MPDPAWHVDLQRRAERVIGDLGGLEIQRQAHQPDQEALRVGIDRPRDLGPALVALGADRLVDPKRAVHRVQVETRQDRRRLGRQGQELHLAESLAREAGAALVHGEPAEGARGQICRCSASTSSAASPTSRTTVLAPLTTGAHRWRSSRKYCAPNQGFIETTGVALRIRDRRAINLSKKTTMIRWIKIKIPSALRQALSYSVAAGDVDLLNTSIAKFQPM